MGEVFMNRPNENEQWLLDGDCKICRRQNYCQKDCTRRKRAKDAWLRAAVRSAADEVTGGMYSTIMNKIGAGRYGL